MTGLLYFSINHRRSFGPWRQQVQDEYNLAFVVERKPPTNEHIHESLYYAIHSEHNPVPAKIRMDTGY